MTPHDADKLDRLAQELWEMKVAQATFDRRIVDLEHFRDDYRPRVDGLENESAVAAKVAQLDGARQATKMTRREKLLGLALGIVSIASMILPLVRQ